ncbi:hypothetical protein [Hymenobacter sp. B81]|uniref:hypothetical protein n=1 Tax=Hymenobacter sp. B81 TaxID=3344878 RepID=UPI0037DC9475
MNKATSSNGALLGASLALLAAGAVYGVCRAWPGSGRSKANRRNQSASPAVDVALNREVAESIQPSPGTAHDFTDEGATGNND